MCCHLHRNRCSHTTYKWPNTLSEATRCQHIANDFQKIDNYYDEFTHHAIGQGQTIFVIIFFFLLSFVSRNYCKQYPDPPQATSYNLHDVWALINYSLIHTHFSFFFLLFFLIFSACEAAPAVSSCALDALLFSCDRLASNVRLMELFTCFSDLTISRTCVLSPLLRSYKYFAFFLIVTCLVIILSVWVFFSFCFVSSYSIAKEKKTKNHNVCA